jgi:hypothetical protein
MGTGSSNGGTESSGRAGAAGRAGPAAPDRGPDGRVVAGTGVRFGTNRELQRAHSMVRESSCGDSGMTRPHPGQAALIVPARGLGLTALLGLLTGNRSDPRTVMLRAGGVVGLGICSRCRHFGQATLLPALRSGDSSTDLQAGQAKRITGSILGRVSHPVLVRRNADHGRPNARCRTSSSPHRAPQ